VQLVRAPEPSGDVEFAGHGLHSALPSCAKVPGAHTWQTSSEVAFKTLENVPALQLLQVVRFEALPKDPPEHGAHDCRVSWKKPTSHTHAKMLWLPTAPSVLESAMQPRQSLGEDELLSGLNVSAGQGAHGWLPGDSLNLPASQAAQGSPSLPCQPGLHTHAVCRLEAGGDDDCSGHGEQVALPRSALYVSRAHGAQKTLWLPVYPARHAQSSTAAAAAAAVVELPAHGAHGAEPVASLYEPTAQATQPATSVTRPENPRRQVQLARATAAGLSDADPGGQSVQLPAPGAGLYLPGAQAAQTAPSGPVKPATHEQLSRALEAGGAQVWFGQTRQPPAPGTGL
jgi:hypothetical protein